MGRGRKISQNNISAFGVWFDKVLKERNLSYADAAVLLNITRQSLYCWRKTTYPANPTKLEIAGICMILGVNDDIDELCTRLGLINMTVQVINKAEIKNK